MDEPLFLCLLSFQSIYIFALPEALSGPLCANGGSHLVKLFPTHILISVSVCRNCTVVQYHYKVLFGLRSGTKLL